MVLFFVGILLASCKNDAKTSKVEDQKENTTQENKKVLKVTDTYSVDGINFKLLQNGDQAELKIEAKDRIVKGNIKLSPPCYFLKWNGKVQSFAYPDVKVTHTLVVLGDTVGTDVKKYFGFNENDDFSRICGEAIQGILIKKDSVIVTERVLDGGFMCADPGTDEKIFWEFAHTRETYKKSRNPKYR
ncbi:hypothetical protein GNY06_01560 [Elizabethkingia argentiflava]|uniref:Uncharacterized protein n=2 Tax=Elizabethkingia argenteiflava TaxID=2681556 RepID=A0A845PUG8_9FLAO|nr:hypothetical protein [Elizabethkingia argenteiflava]